MIRCDYLIVGAGMSAAGVCEGIRTADKKGTIIMIGNEPFLPYHRPKLIQGLLGKKPQPVEKLAIHDAKWYAKNKIEVRLGTIVTQFDPDSRVAVLDSGQAIEFKKACICTGSRARRPQVAGWQLGNVFHVRNVRDLLAVREMLELHREITVVGGGFLAAELAAALVSRPKTKVTLMHRGPTLWNKVLDADTAAWLTKYFEKKSVKLMLNEGLNGFEGRTFLKNVQTKSGNRVASGLAVVAAGADVNLGLFANTPLSYPNGTPVSETLETEEKGVFAAGDIAVFPDKIFGAQRRVDHAECALAQGRVAGANMVGKKQQKWEWLPHHTSEVFDLRFDFIGDFSKPPTRCEIEGELSKKKFTIRQYLFQTLMGVVLCNQSPDKVAAACKQVRDWPRDLKRKPN